jgi:Fe-S cluster assembly ATP-binding protein
MKQSNDELRVIGLSVKVGDKDILRNVTFDVQKGTVHVLMGPNGSGKSTIAHALMGHPDYVISSKKSRILLDGVDMTQMETEERARLGLFLAFQSPVAIPGVSVLNLLRSAYESRTQKKTPEVMGSVNNPVLARRVSVGGIGIVDFIEELKKTASKLAIPESLLSRGIHDGFSGGERKKIEILTACMLKPKIAIFDEIDTGLDVDALRVVAGAIGDLAKAGTGVLVITHYQRLLKYLTPDVVHILVAGEVVKEGGSKLSLQIEKDGYKDFTSKNS